jgi:hypothetical protein
MEMTITGNHMIKPRPQLASSNFSTEARFFADKCCHTEKSASHKLNQLGQKFDKFML